MSYYISEVLEFVGPLFRVKKTFTTFWLVSCYAWKNENKVAFYVVVYRFQVTLEESQDEGFYAFSAQACWEMVLQKVNEEIKKRQERNVHTLESISGLQMFGFLSPYTIEVNIYI